MAVQAPVTTGEDEVPPRHRVHRPSGLGPSGAAAVSGLVTFLFTFAWSWRPYPWLDEQATIAIVRRSWTDLARVIWVREAPIGPYYVLLKVWTLPGTALWWLRLPTVLAVTAAAALLAWWLSKAVSTWHGVAAGLVLAVIPSTSRQAQEIRPYGLVIFSGVLAAVTWWLFLRRPGWRTGAGLAVAVALLPAWHALSLTLVPALVLAALAGGRTWGEGVRRGLRVAGVCAVGLLISAPFTVLALVRAKGVGHPPAPTLHSWWLAFQNLVTPYAGRAGSALWWAAAFAAGGLVVAVARRRDEVARESLVLLVLWAVLHPLALLVMGTHGRPSLLIGRYMMLSLPAWAGLAGVGVAGLITTVLRGRQVVGWRRLPAGLVGALLLVVCVGGFAQRAWDSQRRLHAADGHGPDAGAMLAQLRSPDHAGLPVLTHATYGTLALQAMAPDVVPRMPLLRDAAPAGRIVDSDYAGADAERRLRGIDRVLLLMPTFAAHTPQQALALKPQVKDWSVTGVWQDHDWMLLDLRRPAGQP